MAVEIKRRSGENTYSLLRRFKDKVKKGRVLSLAKGNVCYQKPLSKRKQKENAKRRQLNRERRDYLIKIGKIDEDATNQNNKFKKKR